MVEITSKFSLERTNLKAGNVVSPHRRRLKSETTSEPVFVQGIYADENRKPFYRERMAKGSLNKFVTHMMKSCFISRRYKQKCYEFLHNLNSFSEWILEEVNDSD